MINFSDPGIWYDLPFANQFEIDLANVSPIPLGRSRIDIGLKSAAISNPSVISPVACTTAVEFWVGNHPMELYAPSEALNALVRAFGFHQDMLQLSSKVQAVILQWMVKNISPAWEQRFGGSFEVLDVYSAPPPLKENSLRFDIHGISKNPIPIVIIANLDAIKRMPRILREGEPMLDNALDIDLRYCLESCKVDSIYARALTEGDGIILDKDWSPDRITKVLIGKALSASVSESAGQLKVSSMTYLGDRSMEEKISTQDKPTLDIEIGFEVARETLPISKLKKILSGSILPLPKEIGNTITLRSNGRTIATGELLRIESGFAVKIIKIFEAH